MITREKVDQEKVAVTKVVGRRGTDSVDNGGPKVMVLDH